MADKKTKETSKVVAKQNDDFFNVVELVEKADPPKVKVSKKTKEGR